MTTTLSRVALASGAITAPHVMGAQAPPVRVLQIGDGVFLRGFVDWMIDVANDRGVTHFGVAMAGARGGGAGGGTTGALAAQDGLYTVVTRGIDQGRVIEEHRVVTCVADTLDPARDWGRLVAHATNPDLRFVVSNTTEAGIVDGDDAFTPDTRPRGFPAKVTTLLHARFQALGGGADTGLIFLPCELIAANGATLRAIVINQARRWGLGEAFIAWVEGANHFLNTLVDRIVPGHPAADAAALFDAWGYRDPLAVAAEPFHLWVIEGPRHLEAEWPLAKAGLNVVWTDDLTPYRDRKVRILNGAHTASVLAAYLAGLDTVKGMMDDRSFRALIDRAIDREITPFVSMPEAERRHYADQVIERFANPFIRHALIAIALNSVSKWTVRVLPSVKDWAAAHGDAPPILSFSLAACLWFYRGVMEDGELTGRRDAGPYPIKDAAPVLNAITDAWRSHDGDLHHLTDTLLGDTALWGEDLRANPGLPASVAHHLENLRRDGVRATVNALIATPTPTPIAAHSAAGFVNLSPPDADIAVVSVSAN